MTHKRQWAVGVVLMLMVVAFLAVSGNEVAVAAQQQRVQSVYRTFKITNSDVGIACRNGAPPQVAKEAGGKIVIVSCEN